MENEENENTAVEIEIDKRPITRIPANKLPIKTPSPLELIKKVRDRSPKVYVVIVGDEERLIRARSAGTAMKYALRGRVLVRPLLNRETAKLADYLTRGGKIEDAT